MTAATTTPETVTYHVTGMTCGGCVRSVSNAITRALPGTTVAVELATGEVRVTGPQTAEAVAQAVDDAGFGMG